MNIIWGFALILSAMQPNRVGPYTSLNECYAALSEYIVKIETVDTASQYRGSCQEFRKNGKIVVPDPYTEWLTSAQLAALHK